MYYYPTMAACTAGMEKVIQARAVRTNTYLKSSFENIALWSINIVVRDYELVNETT
jgi:hypothetical protein